MVAGGALLAALTAFQFLTGSFGTSFLGFGQAAVQNIVGGVDDVRISGPIGDPNFYAQLLVMLTPLALDRAFAEPRRSRRLAAWGAAALMAASIVFTFSRGGILALGVVVLLMLLRRPARWRALAALALAAALAVPFLPSGYLDRLTALGQVGTVESNTDVSIRGRTAEAGAGWGMFMDHPLTGVGLGNYAGHYQEYARSLGIEVKRRGSRAAQPVPRGGRRDRAPRPGRLRRPGGRGLLGPRHRPPPLAGRRSRGRRRPGLRHRRGTRRLAGHLDVPAPRLRPALSGCSWASPSPSPIWQRPTPPRPRRRRRDSGPGPHRRPTRRPSGAPPRGRSCGTTSRSPRASSWCWPPPRCWPGSSPRRSSASSPSPRWR